MKISEILEIDFDDEHEKQYDKTGFWGERAAGCIVVAKSTKRILLQLRSEHVLQPLTWGVIGGASDGDETPVATVKREIKEEIGYNGQIKFIPAHIFKKNDFEYHNFIAVVENEFEPIASEDAEWEAAGYGWVMFGDWPKPLHFGLEALLNDLKSLKILKQYCL